MLQALTNKSIEPKALSGAKGKAAAEGAAVDAETALEGADFANELSAAEQGAVQVSPELMMEAPSKLIKVPGAEAGSAEGINPKIFDPALTNGVEKIVQPKTTGVDQLTNEQILQIANGEMPVDPEIAQALLKTPQVQNGRSPSLDMASSEIDPQLMNMEDFLAQKNLAAKKHLNNAHAYGLNPKASMQKAGLEHGLNSTQTINELGGSTGEASGGANSGINSQQFILSSQIDMGSNAQANEATASVKTFNMSNIKTENSNQIMNQITDYIVQAKASKEPTVNMRVNHEQLGMIDITVNRVAAGSDAIAINIGTHSIDGKNFFQTNSKDLFSHLTSTGLNISDLKVETPSQTAKSDFDFGGQSGRGSAQDRQFGSEQNQRRHEQERRQDLWNLLKDKEAA
jgi:hypothetical protein